MKLNQEHKVLAVLFGVTVCFGCLLALSLVRFASNRPTSGPRLLSNPSSVALGAASTKAAANTAYTLVEFMDYQCPPCRALSSRLPEILAPFGSKVRLNTRNLPLKQHPYAMQAAITAEAAREQGKFEPVHVALRSSELRPQEIEAIISQNHLDKVKYKASCLGTAKQRVAQDMEDANHLGLHATPSFVLCCPDGKIYQLTALEQLNQLIK